MVSHTGGEDDRAAGRFLARGALGDEVLAIAPGRDDGLFDERDGVHAQLLAREPAQFAGGDPAGKAG